MSETKKLTIAYGSTITPAFVTGLQKLCQVGFPFKTALALHKSAQIFETEQSVFRKTIETLRAKHANDEAGFRAEVEEAVKATFEIPLTEKLQIPADAPALLSAFEIAAVESLLEV